MAEEKKCTGRCEMCSPNQRTYCAAQKAYYIEQDMAEIKALLKRNAGEVEIINQGITLEDE
jgi:hypothetical protein